MNSLNIVLTYRYISTLVTLTWADILFGINHGILNIEAAVAHAVASLETEENPSQEIIDLAWLTEGESIHPYIDELINLEPVQDEQEIKEKFLYVLLNWVYEHKETYEDPLGTVEYIYADFNYPVEMSSFIKYMPSNHPDLGSLELNKQHLLHNWKNYLNAQKKKFGETYNGRGHGYD